MANDAVFLDCIELAKVLAVLKENFFFDDQPIHLGPAASGRPSVHIPCGVKSNQQAE